MYKIITKDNGKFGIKTVDESGNSAGIDPRDFVSEHDAQAAIDEMSESNTQTEENKTENTESQEKTDEKGNVNQEGSNITGEGANKTE